MCYSNIWIKSFDRQWRKITFHFSVFTTIYVVSIRKRQQQNHFYTQSNITVLNVLYMLRLYISLVSIRWIHTVRSLSQSLYRRPLPGLQQQLRCEAAEAAAMPFTVITDTSSVLCIVVIGVLLHSRCNDCSAMDCSASYRHGDQIPTTKFVLKSIKDFHFE